jgi:hypothetical protein
MGTITLQVQLDTHDELGGEPVDPEKLAMAVYRALDFALDGEIENTESLNYHDIGQISVSVMNLNVPELVSELSLAQGLLEEAIESHIYDAANGEFPPLDCAYVAGVNRIKQLLRDV